MSGDRVPEIEARWAHTSPVPWQARPHEMRRNCATVRTTDEHGTFVAQYLTPEDAEAVAHAPEDLAWLIGEVARLRRYILDLGHDL